jgi:malonyl-CoA O-methyltransferase
MMDAMSSVRGGYDRWAVVYDHDGNPLQGLEEPAVRAAVGDVRGLNILDLGCGTGRHSLWLAAAGATVTAVDFSEGMLAEARR